MKYAMRSYQSYGVRPPLHMICHNLVVVWTVHVRYIAVKHDDNVHQHYDRNTTLLQGYDFGMFDDVEIKISGLFLFVCLVVRIVLLSVTGVCLRALTTDTAGQLNILRHDSNTLGVDSTQVGIFEKTYQVCFGGFLEGENGRSLKTKITLEILGDLTNQTLERKLSDEKVGTLLVSTDLSKGNGSGSVSVGLLDSSGGWGRLSRSLGGKLFAGGLSSGGLAGGLFSSCHGAK